MPDLEELRAKRCGTHDVGLTLQCRRIIDGGTAQGAGYRDTLLQLLDDMPAFMSHFVPVAGGKVTLGATGKGMGAELGGLIRVFVNAKI